MSQGKKTGCPDCATQSSRYPRGLIRRIYCRAAFRCDKCGARFYYYRSFVAIFQRYCQCPLCHNHDVRELMSPDKLDRMTSNPLRRLLIVFGTPLYHCTFCRVQFRDWRPLDPERSSRARAQKAG